MLFVTCMRPEYVWHFKNEAEIAEIAIKEYIEDFKAKKGGIKEETEGDEAAEGEGEPKEEG